jgi:hypothetical protein
MLIKNEFEANKVRRGPSNSYVKCFRQTGISTGQADGLWQGSHDPSFEEWRIVVGENWVPAFAGTTS